MEKKVASYTQIQGQRIWDERSDSFETLLVVAAHFHR
jgi:hypothetical protein